MQEPYDQGLVNQFGPAPCADVREGMGEALPHHTGLGALAAAPHPDAPFLVGPAAGPP